MKRMISIAAGLASGAAVLSALPAVAQASTVPDCTTSHLSASWRVTDAGAGHYYGRMKLTNRGTSPCHIYGFGGLSFVGYGNGTQVGAAADRVGTATGFDIAPGRSAVSEVDVTVAQNYSAADCRPTPVDGFRVYPPDQTRSLFVPFTTTGCANRAVHLLRMKAYVKA